jgi:hypothetical protein
MSLDMENLICLVGLICKLWWQSQSTSHDSQQLNAYNSIEMAFKAQQLNIFQYQNASFLKVQLFGFVFMMAVIYQDPSVLQPLVMDNSVCNNSYDFRMNLDSILKP